MQAIFDASKVEEDGQPAAYVVSTEAVAALINVMAAILEGAPGCETPKAMRELTEGIGRKILVQMRQMRRVIETTGNAPLKPSTRGRTDHVQSLPFHTGGV